MIREKDPDDIGNRDVGKGVDFYSLEKEIALGKGLAHEVERQAKVINDTVIAEYVNTTTAIALTTKGTCIFGFAAKARWEGRHLWQLPEEPGMDARH